MDLEMNGNPFGRAISGTCFSSLNIRHFSGSKKTLAEAILLLYPFA